MGMIAIRASLFADKEVYWIRLLDASKLMLTQTAPLYTSLINNFWQCPNDFWVILASWTTDACIQINIWGMNDLHSLCFFGRLFWSFLVKHVILDGWVSDSLKQSRHVPLTTYEAGNLLLALSFLFLMPSVDLHCVKFNPQVWISKCGRFWLHYQLMHCR